MEAVGLEQLKSHLSEYVARARDGEPIIITDRGREVAVLESLSPSRRAMLALRSAGKVSWNGGKPSGLRGYAIRGEPLAQTVLEQRR